MSEVNYSELVQKWYMDTVNPEELDAKVSATIDYVKGFKEAEDGEWVVWAYEVVSGSHGQFTVQHFIEEVTGLHGKYENMDMDERMGVYDEVSHLLTNMFNHYTTLPGKFTVGHNEADGSLGVYYSVRA